MKLRTLAALFALCFPAALVACSSAPDDASDPNDSSEDDLTARQTLQGSWKGGLQGLDLRPGGDFFWDTYKATQQAGNPLPPDRKEGTWHANKRKSTLTIEAVDGSETVYHYTYSAGPILNGFPGPGGFPDRSKLTLEQISPATASPVVIKLDKAPSWCTSPVDCQLEKQDKTWRPVSSTGAPVCKANACDSGPATTETTALECGPSKVLNGFIDPHSIWTADVKMQLPRILNGFAIPTYTVTVKKGSDVVAQLDKCTGSVASWDLRCLPSDGALGVSRVFELTNKAQQAGDYTTQVIAPNAPVEEHDFRCTPPAQ